jgi:hypothetical protein
VLWGALLIVAGALLLVETVIDLSAWLWIAVLVAGALVSTGLYVRERSDWSMLLTAYVLWVVALLVLLIELNILRDEGIAFYVLLAVALPFLGVWYRDRTLWWALIPFYVLLVVAVMVGLIGLGILGDLLVPAYIMFAIAIPFFGVYLWDRRQWYLLIPGGVLAVVGLALLFAEAAFEYIGALVLILVGLGMLVRAFARRGSSDQARPPEASQ